MPVTKEDKPKPDEKPDEKSDDKPQDEKKAEARKDSGPSIAEVVAAIARNTTFTQHNPEDADLVGKFLAKHEGK